MLKLWSVSWHLLRRREEMPAERVDQVKVNVGMPDRIIRVLRDVVNMPGAHPDNGVSVQFRFSSDHLHGAFSGVENPEIIIGNDAPDPCFGTRYAAFPQGIACGHDSDFQMIPIKVHVYRPVPV